MTVDFQSLILDTSQIKKDFFAYETDASLIATFEHNDLINDWHIERIRRFNASTKTWVAAPTIRPFCKIGEPLTSDCHQEQHFSCFSEISTGLQIRLTQWYWRCKIIYTAAQKHVGDNP